MKKTCTPRPRSSVSRLGFAGTAFLLTTLPLTHAQTTVGDTTRPTVTAFAGDSLTTSTHARFTLNFSEPVTGVTPQLFLVAAEDGLSVSGSPTVERNTTAETNSYRILVPVTGVVGNVRLTLNTSMFDLVRDNESNPLAGDALTAVSRMQIGVLRMTAPSAGNYTSGMNLDFVITFSGPVTVTGSPSVFLTLGANEQRSFREATYRSGSGTDALLFRYTVLPGDSDADGISVSGPLSLNGGSAVKSTTAGTDANSMFPTPNTALVLVNSPPPSSPPPPPAPVILGITPDTGTPGDGITASETTIHGTSIPNAKITLRSLVTGSVVTLTSSATGTWSHFLPGLPPRETEALRLSNVYAAAATNDAGVTSAYSAPFTVLKIYPPTVTPPTIPAVVGQPMSFDTYMYVYSWYEAPRTIAVYDLPPGLTASGSRVSGAPTTAGTYSYKIEANNGAGTTVGVGSFVVAAAAAPVPGPVPAPAPAPVPAPVPPSTGAGTIAPVVALSQTITFSRPATVVVGQSFTVVASASSGLPTTLTVVSGNASVNGSQVTLHSTAPTTLRATQAGNGTYSATTADVILSAVPAPQTVDFVSPVSAIVIGQPVALSAQASSGLPITFSVVSGNGTVNGNSLTVTGTGPVVIRATQPGSDSVAAASAEVTVEGTRRAQTLAMTTASELLSDAKISLAATSTSGLPVQFEVASGPARVEGNLLIPTATSGTVMLRATQSGSATYEAATITRTVRIVAAARLVNLSSLVTVREGDDGAFIAGFVVSGPTAKRLVLRAVGPGLRAFGVQNALPDPRLRVFDGTGALVATSDNWSGDELAAAFTRVGAFALPTGSLDAAIVSSLAPGAYTLHVDAVAGTGIALAEIYDASETPALERQQIVNLSTRALVSAGGSTVTAGFVVTGERPQRVLIRGVGPTLGAFNVDGVLADPTLQLFRQSTLLAQNNDWGFPQPLADQSPPAAAPIAAATSSAGGFALVPGSKDAAILITLPAGSYTAVLAGANGASGTGLLEVYPIAEQ